MGRTIGRCVDDTSLGAAQEHLLAADDEVDASVSGNDGSAAAHRSPERALLTQDRFGIHVSIVELRATRVQRGCHGWISKVKRSRWQVVQGASLSVVAIPAGLPPGVVGTGGGIVGALFFDQDSQGVHPRCPPRTSLPCPR